MRKRLLCCAMILSMLGVPLSAGALEIKTNDRGPAVVLLQRRLQELDYFHFKPTGVFGGMTRTAVMRFQEGNDLTASGSGVVDDNVFKLIFSPNVKRNPVPVDVKIPIGPALKGTPDKIGEKEPWSSVKAQLRQGSNIRITDFNTGKTFDIRYFGGENHAEVECYSKEDTKAFLSAFGGAPNWSKRPVLVSIGTRYIAASMQGMPSGTDRIPDNDMDGVCCLYFTGSTSDILGVSDAEHDANILRASSSEDAR